MSKRGIDRQQEKEDGKSESIQKNGIKAEKYVRRYSRKKVWERENQRWFVCFYLNPNLYSLIMIFEEWLDTYRNFREQKV